MTLTPQYPEKNCYLEGEERAHVNERNFFMRVWELPTVACLESVGGDKFVYQFEASKKKRSVETQTNMPNKVQFNWYTLWGHIIHHPTYGRGTPTSSIGKVCFCIKKRIDYSFDESHFPISWLWA